MGRNDRGERTSYVGKTFNFGCGLSDVHNLIGVQLKLDVPLSKARWRTYRSFRNFDGDNFKCELNKRLVSINFSENKDVNEMYETFTSIISEVTDKYAPLKKKKCLSKPVPYMNKFLKQAVYKKRMLFNKYQNHRSSSNWEKFRQQRNLVTKLKRKSINRYFIERCVGGCKAKDIFNK